MEAILLFRAGAGVEGGVENSGVSDGNQDGAAEGRVGGHVAHQVRFDLAVQHRSTAEGQGAIGLHIEHIVG